MFNNSGTLPLEIKPSRRPKLISVELGHPQLVESVMGCNSDADDFAEEELDGESDQSSSCPFCGSPDDSCQHYLGCQDLNSGGGFSIDYGPLCDICEILDQLRDSVDLFLNGPKKKLRIASIVPRRLRQLVQNVDRGDENEGFAKYVTSLGRDAKVPVEVTSYEETEGGPGMCSVMQMFWAANVSSAMFGMRSRVQQDIKRLQKRS